MPELTPQDFVTKWKRATSRERQVYQEHFIALCHFDLTMKELGIKGEWVVQEPTFKKPGELMEYAASWVAGDIGIL